MLTRTRQHRRVGAIDLINPLTGEAVTSHKRRTRPPLRALAARWLLALPVLVALGMHLCDRYNNIMARSTRRPSTPPIRGSPRAAPRRLLARRGRSASRAMASAGMIASGPAGLSDPPDGCHFGVACMGDDRAVEVDGTAMRAPSTRTAVPGPQAVDLYNMRWAKQDEPAGAVDLAADGLCVRVY